jgi:hypothetical protein
MQWKMFRRTIAPDWEGEKEKFHNIVNGQMRQKITLKTSLGTAKFNISMDFFFVPWRIIC